MAECMRNAFSPCRSEAAAAYNTMVTRVRTVLNALRQGVSARAETGQRDYIC